MRALIFDIDGTLWDTRAISARGYNAALREMGRTDMVVTPEYLATLFGRTGEEIADIVFADYPKEERMGYFNRVLELEDIELQADPCQEDFPGVRDTLRKLHGQYRLFVVSNCDCGYPELMMEKLGLADIFEGHMCHGDTHLPKGDTILALMERHGIEDAVYIGDTQGDLVASRKAGIPFVYCAYGFGDPAEWDAKIDEFSQLPDVLKTL